MVTKYRDEHPVSEYLNISAAAQGAGHGETRELRLKWMLFEIAAAFFAKNNGESTNSLPWRRLTLPAHTRSSRCALG
jgi:hypothetical protein